MSIVKSIRLILVLLFIAMLSGCIRRDHIISRPIINFNPNWTMVEECGYEGCLPMVDFLTSKDMKIRIQSFNHMENIGLFLVTVDFFSKNNSEFSFNHSDVIVKLGDGTVLKPKGFTCSYTRWDLEYLRSAPPLSGSIPISENNCFLLFFDYPSPSVEEEFEMNLDGLKRNGEAVEVPTVYFKKGISRY
ncbi:MAG: hypothetical protein HY807_01680 [Nitrospirae bacterium]|nr:hypothetical protein [Nitrospirota bacterium]